MKEPFNVNSLAQAAAAAAITDEEHVKKSIQVNTVGREQLYKALNELGLHYIESMRNKMKQKVLSERLYLVVPTFVTIN